MSFRDFDRRVKGEPDPDAKRSSKRGEWIPMLAALVIVTAGLLVWHFVIEPWWNRPTAAERSQR